MYEQYLYKQQLLNAFGKDSELVDNVKLQLRQKIITKLKSSKSVTAPRVQQSLIKKLCNTLLMQYLQNQRYFHTLAVFSPEASYTKHHFSPEQMRGMFLVDRHPDQSVLEAVVRQSMPRGRMVQKRVETAAQTDDRQTIQNLQNKLSALDFSYKQKMVQGLKTVEDSQVRFLKYKNEMNKRYKQELEAEINRIRSFQLANIRMEEQEKSRLRMRELQEELQGGYRVKMEKLRQREADVVQRVTAKMKEVESYSYQARQRVLKDMQTVRAREEEVQRMKEELQGKLAMSNSK